MQFNNNNFNLMLLSFIIILSLTIIVTIQDKLYKKDENAALNGDESSNPMKFKLPIELPDKNNDGFAEIQDFQTAFAKNNLNRFEISQIFDFIDKNKQGKIDKKQWNDFYISFITPFENADSEPRDGLINEEEVKVVLGDKPGLLESINNTKRPNYIAEIMETLTSRVQQSIGEGKLSLNLNEYLFLRKATIAWDSCQAQNGFIQTDQIIECALRILLPRSIIINQNLSRPLVHVLENYSRFDEIQGNSFRFLSFVSVVHKFQLFQTLKASTQSSVLTYQQLYQALKDGPSQKITQASLDVIFQKYNKENEHSGLDFKQFFLFMQSIDFVYIYGKSEAGVLNLEEWQSYVKDNLINPNILDNIDDCYIDQPEPELKELKTDHWTRQKNMIETHRNRRKLQKKYKNLFKNVIIHRKKRMSRSLPENTDSRKFTYQIFDLNEDGRLNGGEVFLFYKFSFFFKELTKNGAHLIYQRNFQNDYDTQRGTFDMALLKEELSEFRELTIYLQDRDKNVETGFNWLQFASWFNYKIHIKNIGQQADQSDKIPFTKYKKVLEYLGFQIYRTDIENNIQYSLQQKSVINAQKYDLKAYENDGAFVIFEQAFRENLNRYSNTFSMIKFFGNTPDDKKTDKIKRFRS